MLQIMLTRSGPYWLADLMAGYTVENTSVVPADSFDLERILASGGLGFTPGALEGTGLTPSVPERAPSQDPNNASSWKADSETGGARPAQGLE